MANVDDNCPLEANADQLDTDMDGIGNLCQESLFIRGDANSDAALDISDPIFVLNVIFRGIGIIRCFDGADFNDDGRVDISDVINQITLLFLDSRVVVPEPYPNRGPDPTLDDLPSCQL